MQGKVFFTQRRAAVLLCVVLLVLAQQVSEIQNHEIQIGRLVVRFLYCLQYEGGNVLLLFQRTRDQTKHRSHILRNISS